MIFSRLWILGRIAPLLFLLMADFAFNYGVTLCTGSILNSRGNSSSGGGGHLNSNVLSNYLTTVLNKSRALEEVIYSDILNNLRSLLKTERNQSGESGRTVYQSHDARGKSEHRTGNRTISRVPLHWNMTDTFVTGAGDAGNAGRSPSSWRNVTGRGAAAPAASEYFLAYSGNPFGSRQPISGLVEVPAIDPLGKGVTDPRKKRSVVHLYNMVLCTTGCNPFAYKGYGCYCGFLGSGFVVDGIDSCCKMHDWCYNSAGCPMFLEYFIPYLWQCHHRQPLCAIDHGYYGGPGSCAQRLCECDRQLALCLRRYPCPSTKALCTSSPWRLLQNVLML